MKLTHDILKSYQSLPLDYKVSLTQDNIFKWYQHWNGQVCVSFSGGKDNEKKYKMKSHLQEY